MLEDSDKKLIDDIVALSRVPTTTHRLREQILNLPNCMKMRKKTPKK